MLYLTKSRKSWKRYNRTKRYEIEVVNQGELSKAYWFRRLPCPSVSGDKDVLSSRDKGYSFHKRQGRGQGVLQPQTPSMPACMFRGSVFPTEKGKAS